MLCTAMELLHFLHTSSLSMQHEEVKACVEEYAVVGIWDSELSAAGEPVITFNEACRPWSQ